MQVVQVMLWYLDSGCSKHMTGNRSKLMNFVEKFIGSVRFGNDHLGAIMGYGDYVMGDSVISRVYYVEGLGHNLFSVGQFCDSDLEVAFRKHTCFVRDINGTDILKGSRSTNLYTISMDEMIPPPKLKFAKGSSLLSPSQLGKKQGVLPPAKSENYKNMEDLSYTSHGWVVGLNKTVRFIRTDNGTEFVNQVMSEYYEGVGIFHQKSVPRTPQQNGVVERRNRTLVEAARTMMIFSKAPMFLWAEAVATALFGALCYPTNDSENLGKFQAKADIGIFVGYAPSRKGYRIYNQRTRRLMETIHVTFDEMHQSMAPVAMRSGYQQKDRKPSQNDKTEHGMEKTVQNQGQKIRCRTNVPGSTLLSEQMSRCTSLSVVTNTGKANTFQFTKDSKGTPSFRISVDILSNTNFFQAFTASANDPAIYLQQF
ncbi:integrase, catalytic region, zinc finger, CCHC-type containing protein [Tanacetum coccineum]